MKRVRSIGWKRTWRKRATILLGAELEAIIRKEGFYEGLTRTRKIRLEYGRVLAIARVGLVFGLSIAVAILDITFRHQINWLVLCLGTSVLLALALGFTISSKYKNWFGVLFALVIIIVLPLYLDEAAREWLSAVYIILLLFLIGPLFSEHNYRIYPLTHTTFNYINVVRLLWR